MGWEIKIEDRAVFSISILHVRNVGLDRQLNISDAGGCWETALQFNNHNQTGKKSCVVAMVHFQFKVKPGYIVTLSQKPTKQRSKKRNRGIHLCLL